MNKKLIVIFSVFIVVTLAITISIFYYAGKYKEHAANVLNHNSIIEISALDSASLSWWPIPHVTIYNSNAKLAIAKSLLAEDNVKLNDIMADIKSSEIILYFNWGDIWNIITGDKNPKPNSIEFKDSEIELFLDYKEHASQNKNSANIASWAQKFQNISFLNSNIIIRNNERITNHWPVADSFYDKLIMSNADIKLSKSNAIIWQITMNWRELDANISLNGQLGSDNEQIFSTAIDHPLITGKFTIPQKIKQSRSGPEITFNSQITLNNIGRWWQMLNNAADSPEYQLDKTTQNSNLEVELTGKFINDLLNLRDVNIKNDYITAQKNQLSIYFAKEGIDEIKNISINSNIKYLNGNKFAPIWRYYQDLWLNTNMWQEVLSTLLPNIENLPIEQIILSSKIDELDLNINNQSGMMNNIDLTVMADKSSINLINFSGIMPGESNFKIAGLISNDLSLAGIVGNLYEVELGRKTPFFEGDIALNSQKLGDLLIWLGKLPHSANAQGIEQFSYGSKAYILGNKVRLADIEAKLDRSEIIGTIIADLNIEPYPIIANIKTGIIPLHKYFDFSKLLYKKHDEFGDIVTDSKNGLDIIRDSLASLPIKLSVNSNILALIYQQGYIKNLSFNMSMAPNELAINNIKGVANDGSLESAVFVSVVDNERTKEPEKLSVKMAIKAQRFNEDWLSVFIRNNINNTTSNQENTGQNSNQPSDKPSDQTSDTSDAIIEFANYSDSGDEIDNRWSTKLWDFSWLNSVDIKAQYKFASAKIGDVEWQDIDAKLAMKNEILEIPALTAKLFGGDFQSRLRIYGGKVPGMYFIFKIDNANLNEIKDRFLSLGLNYSKHAINTANNQTSKNDQKTKPTLSGKVNAEGNFETSGIHQASWVKNMNGSISSSASRFTINGFDLGRFIALLPSMRSAGDVISTGRNILGKSKTEFRKIEGNIFLRDGKAVLSNFVLDFPDSYTSFSGAADLMNWEMDILLQNRINANYTKSIPVFSIRYKGGIDAPERILDTSIVEDYIEERNSQRNIR